MFYPSTFLPNPKFYFGYCSRGCPDLKITLYIFCSYLLVTWPLRHRWKNWSHKTYYIWCQWKQNFMLLNFSKTYGCFLLVFGLLIFKECMTWPRYKGWIFFSYHVPVLCWSISSVESIADFCPFWDYWPSKNGSRNDDIKGEFVSLAKPFVVGTTGKKILR